MSINDYSEEQRDFQIYPGRIQVDYFKIAGNLPADLNLFATSQQKNLLAIIY